MNWIEKDIEKYLKRKIEEKGGLCWKFTSPSRRGVPDRWCAYKGYQFFVELKAPQSKPRKDERLQKAIHQEMARQGVRVYVLRSKVDVDILLSALSHGYLPRESYFGRL